MLSLLSQKLQEKLIEKLKKQLSKTNQEVGDPDDVAASPAEKPRTLQEIRNLTPQTPNAKGSSPKISLVSVKAISRHFVDKHTNAMKFYTVFHNAKGDWKNRAFFINKGQDVFSQYCKKHGLLQSGKSTPMLSKGMKSKVNKQHKEALDTTTNAISKSPSISVTKGKDQSNQKTTPNKVHTGKRKGSTNPSSSGTKRRLKRVKPQYKEDVVLHFCTKMHKSTQDFIMENQTSYFQVGQPLHGTKCCGHRCQKIFFHKLDSNNKNAYAVSDFNAVYRCTDNGKGCMYCICFDCYLKIEKKQAGGGRPKRSCKK